jgi:hypothetical protein
MAAMLAVILSAWTLWIWTPDTGALHKDPESGKTFVSQPGAPVAIPKEYRDEGHCLSSLAARKAQGYLPENVVGRCLPSGMVPSP